MQKNNSNSNYTLTVNSNFGKSVKNVRAGLWPAALSAIAIQINDFSARRKRRIFSEFNLQYFMCPLTKSETHSTLKMKNSFCCEAANSNCQLLTVTVIWIKDEQVTVIWNPPLTPLIFDSPISCIDCIRLLRFIHAF